jgi:primary-amine oxidase
MSPLLPGAGLVALVTALLPVAPATAQAARHPLDPLTAQEHWAVYDVLRDSGRMDEKTRYSTVRLDPPPKQDVLRWEPGHPVPRRAFATLVKGGKTYDAVVDVAARTLVSWKEATGEFAGVTDGEDDALTDLVKENEEFRAALRKRGIVDLNTVECWALTPGYFGRPEQRSRRLAEVRCEDRHGVFDATGRPVEGLRALVDVTEEKVLEVFDSGAVATPRGNPDYDAESIGPPRAPSTPISVEQPGGPGFSLNGHEVRWQKWTFRFRLEARRGVVVSLVRYADGDRERSVMYEGSLSELFVPYMDPAAGWHNLTYLDLGDYGAGGLARRIEPGTECPANGVALDSLVADDRGLPRRMPCTACLFERLDGQIAWTHAQGNVVDARARRDLVLRWIATIGNYDYVFDWVFRQDGSINVVVGATGVVVVKAVKARTAAEQQPGGPRDDAYGRFVAENAVAVNHDHFFCFRLDLDVDGIANSLVIDRLKTRRLPEESERKSVWVVEAQTAVKESQGQLDAHRDGEGYWRVVNPQQIGPLGYPASYEIRAGHGATSLLLPEDYPQLRAGFTRHALWVTPQRDDEVYAAGEHTPQSREGAGLPAWTAADRPIAATDIVAWYTLGMHHMVRAEDWPVMPTAWHSFELRPFDFFSRNPALDLPRRP